MTSKTTNKFSPKVRSRAVRWFWIRRASTHGWAAVTSSDSGLTSDHSISFEGDDHLVDRRRADAEVVLHVGFGWRPADHVRIDVNASQILALLVGEALPARMTAVA
ncbi:hypothetical protein GGE24_007524 [Bradyrhizobium centrosematis]|nr:hypothetical protein [Bradyrhizobium centrosematis]MCS3778149.1 hypothetical protein [Bradyrhizobium centrosematis]